VVIVDLGQITSLIDDRVTTGGATNATIASGVITYSSSFMSIDTQGAAGTDDLDTINGGTEGDLLVLRATDSTRTVVLTDAGNIVINQSHHLSNGNDRAVVQKSGSNWLLISFSANRDGRPLNLGRRNITIDSGTIDYESDGFIRLVGEQGPSDDLAVINNGGEGALIILGVASSSPGTVDVVNSGNISLQSSPRALVDSDSYLVLLNVGDWREISFVP